MNVYLAAVGSNWNPLDNTPAPDRTCGHKHRSMAAACKCGERLYSATRVAGSWQANAAWHNWYVIGPDNRKATHD